MAVTSTRMGSITVTDDVTSETITFPLTQKRLDVAPTLSAPTVVETTSDSATVSVATDLPGEGVMLARIYEATATPSDADVLAGTGALHTQSGVPDATTQFAFNLIPDQDRKAHFVHQCSAIVSNVVATATFVASTDTTAPILSNATATTTGETSVDWSVDTDEGNGTLAVEIRDGATVVDTASESIGSAGTKTGSFTGLTEGTTYTVAMQQTDAAGNVSAEITASVTTDAAVSGYTLAAADRLRTNTPPEHTGMTIRFHGNLPVDTSFFINHESDAINIDLSGGRFDITAVKNSSNQRIPPSGAESSPYAADAATAQHDYLFVIDYTVARFAIYQDGVTLYDHTDTGAIGSPNRRQLTFWSTGLSDVEITRVDIWTEARFDGQAPTSTPWATDGGNGVDTVNMAMEPSV